MERSTEPQLAGKLFISLLFPCERKGYRGHVLFTEGDNGGIEVLFIIPSGKISPKDAEFQDAAAAFNYALGCVIKHPDFVSDLAKSPSNSPD